MSHQPSLRRPPASRKPSPTTRRPCAGEVQPVLFLGFDDVARLVRRTGVAGCLAAIASRIERDFLRWSEFDKAARLAAHSKAGVIELMPIADATRFAFKYVNGHPQNTQLGLPTVMAFGVLADVATGAPLLLCELTMATALRTAAMSALAAKRLARADSRVMAMIGNGAQAEFQAIAFRELLGIRHLRLFDVDPAATDKLGTNLRAGGFEIVRCAGVEDALRGADIVTTITADKRRATILRDAMVGPGVHLNAVGGDCPGKTELDRALVARASVFVEYEPQSRLEGEIQQLPADFPVCEFWRVLAGEVPGRRSAQELTLFDSVGFALEDFSTLQFLQQAALELGIGQPLDLLPRGRDPKDLYGALRDGVDDPGLVGAGAPSVAQALAEHAGHARRLGAAMQRQAPVAQPQVTGRHAVEATQVFDPALVDDHLLPVDRVRGVAEKAP